MGLIWISWLVGCAGGLTKERLVTLEDAIQAYASGVRWQHHELLNTLIRPQDQQPKPISREFWDNVRVTGYEIRGRQLSEDALTAEVTIEFDYYHPDDSVIRSLTTQQSWWYEEESRRWFLDGNLPNFTQASSSH
ncbi:conserved hypothetical protein [Nitrosococcus halophilus Nc 4]|uniref:Uncharacterized protein n=1 Tax=Nitrosococcus halophilus (strain Nc4) TaxID=472759 RepID=D5BZE2_NITHN|nr:hypothetical protein [Nitrosococcus halophilus]ADE16156.1 conserved hypothetical protein [Nitrosococcus halophilus Nc 4]